MKNDRPLCGGTDATCLRRMGLLPADPTRSRAEQARDVFERMEAVLLAAGMDFRHVVRTWFRLDDVLTWYGEFNAVRNAFFRERGVFGRVVPASTGVGGPNPAGAALVAGVLAVRPGKDPVTVRAVASPLQCPAIDYESAFSRAVEVEAGGRRHLYVSGTASIDERGASRHAGDVDAQIRLSMEVVEAILGSRRMTWADTVGGIAYFTHLKDAPRFEAWRRAHGLLGLPLEAVHATVCRDELLFELELETATDASAP